MKMDEGIGKWFEWFESGHGERFIKYGRRNK